MEADTSEMDALQEQQEVADRAPLPIERASGVDGEHDTVWVAAAEGPRALDRSKGSEIAALFDAAHERQRIALGEAAAGNGRRRRNGRS